MSNATSYLYGKPQGNKTNFSIEDKKSDKKETTNDRKDIVKSISSSSGVPKCFLEGLNKL